MAMDTTRSTNEMARNLETLFSDIKRGVFISNMSAFRSKLRKIYSNPNMDRLMNSFPGLIPEAEEFTILAEEVQEAWRNIRNLGLDFQKNFDKIEEILEDRQRKSLATRQANIAKRKELSGMLTQEM